MEISLQSLKTGEKAVVTKLEVSEELEKRLRDFGLIPDTVVSCRYCSPGRDVKALEVRGAVVAVRTKDLEGIRGILL